MRASFRTGALNVASPAGKTAGTRHDRCISRPIEVGSLLRALCEAALFLDEHGRIVDWNGFAEKLIGRPSGELFGAKAELLLQECLGGQQEKTRALLSRALGGEWVQCGRETFRTPARDPFPVSLGISPVRDTSGEIAGVLVTIKDLSEVAQLQGELEKGVRHVAVGEMTAGLVHDFSNVLSTISEAVTALETDHQSSEREHTVLDIINHSVSRGAETLSNVRKYLAGKRAPPVQVDVQELLDEVLELTHPALKTHRGLTVVRDTQSCGHVEANADELRRAFTNLVMNSLEAMPEGGTLTVACRRGAGCILASVRDTGAGISPEMQKRIFSTYFTTKAKGTGLGLAGARRAIEAQGGDIRFESSPGQGTTFFVRLPATDEGLVRRDPVAERKVS